jgi:hypothetical protein
MGGGARASPRIAVGRFVFPDQGYSQGYPDNLETKPHSGRRSRTLEASRVRQREC